MFKDNTYSDKYAEIMDNLEEAYNLATNNGEKFNAIGDAIDRARNGIDDLYYTDDRIIF